MATLQVKIEFGREHGFASMWYDVETDEFMNDAADIHELLIFYKDGESTYIRTEEILTWKPPKYKIIEIYHEFYGFPLPHENTTLQEVKKFHKLIEEQPAYAIWVQEEKMDGFSLNFDADFIFHYYGEFESKEYFAEDWMLKHNPSISMTVRNHLDWDSLAVTLINVERRFWYDKGNQGKLHFFHKNVKENLGVG